MCHPSNQKHSKLENKHYLSNVPYYLNVRLVININIKKRLK